MASFVFDNFRDIGPSSITTAASFNDKINKFAVGDDYGNIHIFEDSNTPTTTKISDVIIYFNNHHNF